MPRAPSQLQKCADVGASDRPGVAPEASAQDLLGAAAEAPLGDLPGALEGIGVAALVRSMSEVEVRTLVDEVHASGFVQTLEDASQVLATVDEQAVRRGL
jgi:hypothetical protein